MTQKQACLPSFNLSLIDLWQAHVKIKRFRIFFYESSVEKIQSDLKFSMDKLIVAFNFIHRNYFENGKKWCLIYFKLKFDYKKVWRQNIS